MKNACHCSACQSDNCHLSKSTLTLELSAITLSHNGPDLNPMSRESHVSPLG